MNKSFHTFNPKIKTLIWIIIIITVILGLNQLGTHSSKPTNPINQNNGIAKTHDTQVNRPSKKYIQHKQPNHNHYSGHLKDTPGDDNNPKKG